MSALFLKNGTNLPFSLQWFHLLAPGRKSGAPYGLLNALEVTFVVHVLDEVLKPRREDSKEYQDRLVENESQAYT